MGRGRGPKNCGSRNWVQLLQDIEMTTNENSPFWSSCYVFYNFLIYHYSYLFKTLLSMFFGRHGLIIWMTFGWFPLICDVFRALFMTTLTPDSILLNILTLKLQNFLFFRDSAPACRHFHLYLTYLN